MEEALYKAAKDANHDDSGNPITTDGTFESAFILGADYIIDKALKVYEDLMTCNGYFPETITAELARMRNKLED